MTDYPNPRVRALLDAAAGWKFTTSDFAALCLAAADQAGATAEQQQKIAELLGLCPDCRAEFDDLAECACPDNESESAYLARTGEPRGAGRPNYEAETDRERYERAAQERR